MKLGFYYHIPIVRDDTKVLVPSLIGKFMVELALHVEELILFLHEANDVQDIDNAKMEISSRNIRLVSLGLKTKAWQRTLFYKSILYGLRLEFKLLDALLIRAPSPLAPHFYNYIEARKIVFFIVGDYKEGAKYISSDSIRNIAIKLYLKVYDYYFKRQIKYSNVVVNSYLLYNNMIKINPGTKIVITSTISENDFYFKKVDCNPMKFNILYTGRIDRLKGLFELLDAIIILNKKGFNICLNIAGYENGDKITTRRLVEVAASENVSDILILHGMKQAGSELNEMYRMADIYVIPSYHEGFPRTIWEAMANSCPVIATRVGGIPYFLKDGEHAILIKPKSIEAIVEAIEFLISHIELRNTLIENGYILAQDATMVKQVKLLIDHIFDFIPINKYDYK